MNALIVTITLIVVAAVSWWLLGPWGLLLGLPLGCAMGLMARP